MIISNNEENNIIFNNYKLKTSIYNNNNYKIKDKFFINFVKISSICTYCTKQFSFNNKLYKNISKNS